MPAKLVEITDVMAMAVHLDCNILALNTANAVEFKRIYGIRSKHGDNMLLLLIDRNPPARAAVRLLSVGLRLGPSSTAGGR